MARRRRSERVTRRVAVVAVAALTLITASCGRSDDSESSSAPPTTSTAPASETATTAPAPATEGHALTAADIADQCASEPLQATEIGVAADAITIEVMADTGSSLAPGIFQGDVDAITGFAEYVNANGGIGCRQLVVRTWDSKFDPVEAKNGQLDACVNAFAMVGNNSVFNPDTGAMEQCVDKAGAATGLPNVAAFAVDPNEMCSPVTVGVNTSAEACPIADHQTRDFVRMAGPFERLAETHPGLHGVYLANGDLPSTKVSATPDIAVQEAAGITFDAKLLQSGRDAQSAYIPRVQYLQRGSNYYYDGAADFALVQSMKEAIAQGIDPKKVVWACGVACYTQQFLTTGASAVEGAYVWLQFLPFEEADTNAALDAYISTVGKDKVDTWGATSWQAAIAFQQVVNQIVAEKGPNAITRAALLDGLRSLEDFTADGMAGPRALGDYSPCYVLLQVSEGEFTRVWPEERGTFDCDPTNLATVSLNAEETAATDLG
jgi:hypothetical protein